MTSLPSVKHTLSSKRVYRIKYKSDGSVEHYKARLVVLGNTQKEGVDYTETFAPVVKVVTVRTILSVVSTWNWDVHQMDIHNAFLHVDLTEEVYMRSRLVFMLWVLILFFGWINPCMDSVRLLIVGSLNLLHLSMPMDSCNLMQNIRCLLMRKMVYFFAFSFILMICWFLVMILFPLQNLNPT